MTQHPLRCETCKNTDCDFYDDKQWWFFTFNQGCASHSDAVLEREKVLDELDLWLYSGITQNTWQWGIPYIQIHNKITELRKQGEQK
jgi:hypothetical protein